MRFLVNSIFILHVVPSVFCNLLLAQGVVPARGTIHTISINEAVELALSNNPVVKSTMLRTNYAKTGKLTNINIGPTDVFLKKAR